MLSGNELTWPRQPELIAALDSLNRAVLGAAGWKNNAEGLSPCLAIRDCTLPSAPRWVGRWGDAPHLATTIDLHPSHPFYGQPSAYIQVLIHSHGSLSAFRHTDITWESASIGGAAVSGNSTSSWMAFHIEHIFKSIFSTFLVYFEKEESKRLFVTVKLSVFHPEWLQHSQAWHNLAFLGKNGKQNKTNCSEINC